MNTHLSPTSASHREDRQMTASGRTVRSRSLLIGMLTFNGVGAVGGGAGLMRGGMGLPLRLLEGTPFDSYMIPGLILAFVVGLSSLAVSILVWKRVQGAALASIAAGTILLGWIVTEFVLIPSAWAPQLFYFVIALAIIRHGWMLHREPIHPL